MSIWNEIVRWWNNQDEIDLLTVLNDVKAVQIHVLRQDVASLDLAGTQACFLLNQAPMLDAPADLPFANVGAKFVYIHPETFSKLMNTQIPAETSMWSKTNQKGTVSRWVATPLIPRGRIIFSANQMPGLEPLIARSEDAPCASSNTAR